MNNTKNICKTISLNQLNDSQKIDEHKKIMIQTYEEKIPQNSSPGEIDRCENNFMHLNYEDNILQRFLQSSLTNYFISLKNGGIYKQINKQTTWLNSLIEDENTKYTLVEKVVGIGKSPKSNHPC